MVSILSLPSARSQFAVSLPTFFRSGYCEMHRRRSRWSGPRRCCRSGCRTARRSCPCRPIALAHSWAPSAAPWALLETICALAMPCLVISALTRNTGMPASVAFWTAADVASAPAGSRMIALTLLLMAVVDQLVLLVRVVVVGVDRGLVAELLGLGLGGVGLGLPVGVDGVEGDDGDGAAGRRAAAPRPLRAGGCCRPRGGAGASRRRRRARRSTCTAAAAAVSLRNMVCPSRWMADGADGGAGGRRAAAGPTVSVRPPVVACGLRRLATWTRFAARRFCRRCCTGRPRPRG